MLNKQKSKPKNKDSKHNKTQPPQDPTRRKLLNFARNAAITIGVVGAGGGYLAYSARATMHEQDLTRMGQGKPVVVQVHDPNCPVCQRLQRETKAALKNFDEGQLDYIVANIRSAKGEAFASKYGVPHVTLLLFDASGELQHIMRGEQKAATLKAEFERLIGG